MSSRDWQEARQAKSREAADARAAFAQLQLLQRGIRGKRRNRAVQTLQEIARRSSFRRTASFVDVRTYADKLREEAA